MGETHTGEHKLRDVSTSSSVFTKESSQSTISHRQNINGSVDLTSQSQTKCVLRVFQFLFLVCMTIDFAGLCFLQGLSHLRDQYIYPQLKLMKWNDSPRHKHEITYYHRRCHPHDISANDTVDLRIKPYDSSTTVVQLVQRHGMAIFPPLLTSQAANDLRKFIIAQNSQQKDMIQVIENHQRWSFAMRVDQHPVIAQALQELLSNSLLQNSLEAIMGSDPAVIEFTAITSAYGATDQRWHQDVVPEGSAAKYARSFVPSYSLFIPLQDTTKEMGATQVCPGTHLCGDGDRSNDICSQHGFSVAESGVWPMSSGALVNQQITHRGPAHMDPHAPERVLFIMTFAPRPVTRGLETKYIGTGGSYSMHWTHWGHTLQDFAFSRTRMRQPWRTLKSLGVYRMTDSHWGWDWLTQALGRISNRDGGYEHEDILAFVQMGGFSFLPSWLQLSVANFEGLDLEEDGEDRFTAVEYSTALISKCSNILLLIWICLFGWVALTVCVAQYIETSYDATHTKHPSQRRCITTTAVFHMIIGLAIFVTFQWALETPWARHTRHGNLFRGPKHFTGPELPATLPLDSDVLDIIDYQGTELFSFESIIQCAHPANREWHHTLAKNSLGFDKLEAHLQERLCESLLQYMHAAGSRLLVKNRDNEWGTLSFVEARAFCRRELLCKANDYMDRVHHELDRQLAKLKFGMSRETSLSLRWARSHLESLRQTLVRDAGNRRPSSSYTMNGSSLRIYSPLHLFHKISESRQGSPLPPRIIPVEPYPAAWSESGMVVEALYRHNPSHWYKAKIVGASADSDTWSVLYSDGERDESLCRRCIRPFVSYAVGEHVEWRDEDFVFYPAVIQAIYHDTVDLEITHDADSNIDGMEVRSAVHATLRRPYPMQSLAIGSRVRVLYDEDSSLWVSATILDLDDESADIRYDDGDFEEDVDFDQLVPWIEELDAWYETDTM